MRDIIRSQPVYTINYYGKSLEYNPSEGRKTFVFLLDGKLDINRHILNSKDSARTKDSERLLIKALEKSEFFLIDIN